jgi:hypothetical protein
VTEQSPLAFLGSVKPLQLQLAQHLSQINVGVKEYALDASQTEHVVSVAHVRHPVSEQASHCLFVLFRKNPDEVSQVWHCVKDWQIRQLDKTQSSQKYVPKLR